MEEECAEIHSDLRLRKRTKKKKSKETNVECKRHANEWTYVVKEEAKLADLILIIIKHVLYTNCSWEDPCSVNSAGTVLNK